MYKILLVGAGQIGSRYLQGLVSMNLHLNVTVIDPLDASLDKAKKLWIEAGGDKSQHMIRWYKVLPEDLISIDLAIISTSSKGRAALVKNIRKSIQVNYWVLEKVLTQSKQELDVIKAATIDAKEVWVNMTRRLIDWHHQLKLKFYKKGPLKVKKNGGLWGLGCNGIHFIDLICWWTDESLISVNINGLDQNWFKSRRSEYFEITGELFIKFSGGTELILRSNHNVEEDNLYVELPNKSIWVINEDNGTAQNSKENILNGRLELQSELTAAMVTKILKNGTCDLTTLKQSVGHHEIFLDAMLEHWNFSNKCNDKQVPIT
tara:strand:+ start:413 stop:1369 length:957 start_codon:yes stop_codon:yes gene_type:complete